MTAPTFSQGDPNRPGNKGLLKAIGIAAALVVTVTAALQHSGTATDPGATGPGLSGVQMIGDDYTSYHSTADLRARIAQLVGGTCASSCLYGDGRGAQYVTLDSAVRYNRHSTARYSFVPGAPNNPPELWPGLPRELDDAWMRAVIRFEPGFTTIGNDAGASNAYKLLGWGLGGVDGSGRIEITNTTQYELYWGASKKNTSTAIEIEQFGIPGSVTTEWADGRWRAYTIHWQKTSDSTVDVECWIRAVGETSGLHAKTTTKILAGNPVPPVNSISLGMNFNQPILKPMSLNYAEWEVVDGTQHPNPFGLVPQ